MVHMITDGRDTPPRSALSYLNCLNEAMEATGGRFATVIGRYYAMDRDNRWDRTELAWRAMRDGEGRRAANARAAIEAAYAADEDDEFIRPTVLDGAVPIQNGDQVIHFNLRKDRPPQMVSAFCRKDFDKFDRRGVTDVKVTCMMEYDPWHQGPRPHGPEPHGAADPAGDARALPAPGTCDRVRPRLRSPEAQGWAPLVLRFDRGFDRARRYG
jgi:2,3-bisphosphoglycerate-independent phosphoglycerate mutase